MKKTFICLFLVLLTGCQIKSADTIQAFQRAVENKKEIMFSTTNLLVEQGEYSYPLFKINDYAGQSGDIGIVFNTLQYQNQISAYLVKTISNLIISDTTEVAKNEDIYLIVKYEDTILYFYKTDLLRVKDEKKDNLYALVIGTYEEIFKHISLIKGY